MKKNYYPLFISTVVLFFTTSVTLAQNTIKFDSVSDLATNFNPSPNAIISNGTSQGLSYTGSAEIGQTTEIWTLKNGLPLTTNSNYKVSAFCKIGDNSGRGGLGFTVEDTNATDTYGHPQKTIGFGFHGGGGELINNATTTNVNWPPDLIIGNWYLMELTITYTNSNSFNVDFKIFNCDEFGNLGTLKTNNTFSGELNSSLSSAATLYPYFCHDGSRLSSLDNFYYEKTTFLTNDSINSSENKISFYPNPTSDLIFISNMKNQENYKIYNILGTEIKNGFVYNNSIDVQNFEQGMYFIKLSNGVTKRIIKE